MTKEDQVVFQCLVNSLWGMAKGIEVEGQQRGCVFIPAMVADVLDKCVAMDRRLALEPVQDFLGQPGADCGNPLSVVARLSGRDPRQRVEGVGAAASASEHRPRKEK